MRVIMCQPQFVPKILDGSKPHTIRKSALCKPGDILSLRRWSGKPYRSKQQILRTVTCISVDPVRIENVSGWGFVAWKNGQQQSQEMVEALARNDGFACAKDMLDWFLNTHGLPFDGFLIRWAPDTYGVTTQWLPDRYEQLRKLVEIATIRGYQVSKIGEPHQTRWHFERQSAGQRKQEPPLGYRYAWEPSTEGETFQGQSEARDQRVYTSEIFQEFLKSQMGTKKPF